MEINEQQDSSFEIDSFEQEMSLNQLWKHLGRKQKHPTLELAFKEVTSVTKHAEITILYFR
ncbi:hypothetical protein Ciccas_001671 [Cichlidogyrus casuarinus]|uniref:Uncharacterized protein n=1 Tax=Cichlidogyrus casuarinus TaxID=1844966 RepID=A0ABD2QJD5_9PLAT